MKKYVKPELFYERFELNQHIADCMWEMTASNKTVCSAAPDANMGYNPGNLFIDSLAACTLKDHQYGDFCYENAADQGFSNVWAS